MTSRQVPDLSALARIGKPQQQVEVGLAVLLADRLPGMPNQFVTASDLLNAIRVIVREECDKAIAAALSIQVG